MISCLITGASRGIGQAIALRLAEPGRHLYLHGRDRHALAHVAAEVVAKGGKATTLVHDLADTKDVEFLIEQMRDVPVNLLINNAGMAVAKALEEVTIQDWNRTLAVNVTAPFLLTRALLPHMPQGSAVVNILSTAAKVAFPGWSAYCMSKFALDGFSRAVREEVRGRGIRVINVYPAATDTDIWNTVPGDWPREAMMPPEEVAEAVAYAWARPEEVLVEDITIGPNRGTL